MRLPAPVLMLASVLCVQFGQGFGKQLFTQVGPASVVALRLGFAALMLLALYRPTRLTRGDLLLYLAFGTAIAGMNLSYHAMAHLPLGITSALQMTGPLTVAIFGSRRPTDLGFAVLAGLGVWLCCEPHAGPVSKSGILLALGSGAAMGSYLLLSQRTGAHSTGGSGLAVAVGWAAVVSVPFGMAASGPTLFQPQVLLAGAGVAVLSAVLPYSLELAALRRLPARAVAILVSLEPAAAALAGVVVLSEQLSMLAWIGIGCVTATATAVTARHSR